jgi:GH43 family beta-xylosidase
MKKFILTLAISALAYTASSQLIQEVATKKNLTSYSFAWGLFKSKENPKNKSVVVKVEKPEFSTSFSEFSIDSTKYERKSILWGAIQWTEKKKSSSPIKS